jgi:hypothetical protein
MVFIETSAFSHYIQKLLTDDQYSELQRYLIRYPDAGAIIQASGGLRKIRWAVSGRGKRGGVRVIYYWVIQREQMLMLLIYPKSERDNLTVAQLNALRRVVEGYPSQ